MGEFLPEIAGVVEVGFFGDLESIGHCRVLGGLFSFGLWWLLSGDLQGADLCKKQRVSFEMAVLFSEGDLY